MSSQFEELINRGENLLERGLDLENDEVKSWLSDCRSLVRLKFGKYSKEDKEMRAMNISRRLQILKSINESINVKDNYRNSNKTSVVINVSQNQTTFVKNEVITNIYQTIEKSPDLSEKEKHEAKEIVEEVVSECENKETNWDKVRRLLKNSLDYGFKYAAELMNLVQSYRNLSGK